MNKRLVLLVLAVCIGAVSVTSVHARGPLPGQSKAFGKSLGEWMNHYWTWFLGGDQAGRVKSVVFLPLPSDGQQNVTLKTGEKFVLPMFVFVGETYLPETGTPDDDPASIPDAIFTTADVRITLDGKRIIDSKVDDLEEFFFGPEYFDPVIDYGATAPNGAIGAIWVKGIGFVHHPLTKGRHKLTLYVADNFGIGIEFNNTWIITVK